MGCFGVFVSYAAQDISLGELDTGNQLLDDSGVSPELFHKRTFALIFLPTADNVKSDKIILAQVCLAVNDASYGHVEHFATARQLKDSAGGQSSSGDD